ncbi:MULTISPECIES: flagellin [Agrobacterium]|uniref:flagellin N-terminal helical domain-containing protein n=1 Tax=Agrobacterium TaxID=357 RepID=UPI000713876B|nr:MULTISPECIES: flagellin [Agrobacterium]KQM35614.1 flagellin [Rhizobium sp. Leaf202]KQN88349.1 flagellin [Rhizobium sp. Leaf68]KQZ97674.1 flagellin [Rhizobium sp. Root564]MQB22243.1 flagellin [Agrobacterium tumefaciens]MDD1496970.1 flagellin [Agrobacterium sp. CNPSo 3708]
MTSILTNTSAMSALQTLRSINTSLSDTQNRVSSGYKVSQASDNVAYWSISTTMNSDKKALNAAADALGVGAAKVDTAYAAMESAIGAVNEIKAKLVTASEKSTDKGQIQLEISKLQEQLSAIAQGASFSGENWLVTQSSQANVVDGFVRQADGTVKVTVATFNVGTYALFSTIGANGLGSGGVLGSIMSVALTSISTQGEIDGFMNIVEKALSKMTDSAAAIGALQIRVELQDKYSSKLSDAIEAGVSRLIDADMEEESAKLSAVQTQQQLAIQSLSIANSSSQNLLSLFRQ